MLNLPLSTEVNRRVSKEKIYSHASLTPALRNAIKTKIEFVIWRNKIAASTISVAETKNIKEIQIFEIQLKQRELSTGVLSAIAKAIPYKIIFALTFEDTAQICAEACNTFYSTSWLPLMNLNIKFEGLNLDAVYENIVRQIAAGRLSDNIELSEAVERDKKHRKLEWEIAALENKMLREKQFNRQCEMNEELKKLKKEVED